MCTPLILKSTAVREKQLSTMVILIDDKKLIFLFHFDETMILRHDIDLEFEKKLRRAIIFLLYWYDLIATTIGAIYFLGAVISI